MITVVLFDLDNKPVGRATLPDGSSTPVVVLWNDRAFLYRDENIAGKQYRQVLAHELPLDNLRKAPGLV